MAIKAIVFDLDDTLVVEQASAEAAFLATSAVAHKRYGIEPNEFHQTVRQKARELWHKSPARAYCVSIGISSWEGLWARFDGDDANLKVLRQWAPTYRRQAWSGALAEFGVTDESLAEHLAATFQSQRRRRHIVYSDVEPALKELQEVYKLGLVSNGAPDLQREKLQGSELEPYFDAVVISGEVGVGKPDPKIFAMVLEQLGICSKMAVMVGNSLNSDIAGAQQAGLKAVWLNRDKKELNDSVSPNYEINNMNELRLILNNLE